MGVKMMKKKRRIYLIAGTDKILTKEGKFSHQRKNWHD
jgi:hypothetical protein